MKNYFQQLSNLLSSRWFSFGCIAISLVARTVNVFYVSYVGGDKMMAAVMSRTFLRGNGLSIPEYYVSNVETAVYNSAPLWPPGYTVLLAGFLKLFNYNLWGAFTTIDLLTGIGFIFILRNICRVLEFNTVAINFATLVAGCFNYSFISHSQPTDFLTITLLLWGFYLLIKAVKNAEVKYRQLFVTAFFWVLPCFFRYSYHIAIGVVPVVILLTGYFTKDKLVFRKGKIILLFSAGFYLLMAGTQYLLSGSLFHVFETQKGIYPQNLLHWAPFIPESFISLDFIYTKFFSEIMNTESFYLFFEIINAFAFLLLLIVVFVQLKKINRNTLPSVTKWFAIISVALSAGTLLLLIYVSLTNKEQRFHGVPWNYLTVSRYFALLFVFIQLAFIGWGIGGWGGPIKNTFLKAIRFVLLLLLTVEITHNLYFTAKLSFRFSEYKNAHYWNNRVQYVEKTVLSLIVENPDKEILATAYTHPTASHFAAYYGQKAMMNSENLNKILPRVKKPTLLLVHLTDDELPLFKNFLSATKVPLYKKNEYDNFYLLSLFPSD